MSDPSPHSKTLGFHYLLEFSFCQSPLIHTAELLIQELADCASKAGAQVIKTTIHEFSPHGLSGVVIIAESHVTIHTWPEHHYAAIDIFTCGNQNVAEGTYQNLLASLKPKSHFIKRLERGPV